MMACFDFDSNQFHSKFRVVRKLRRNLDWCQNNAEAMANDGVAARETIIAWILQGLLL